MGICLGLQVLFEKSEEAPGVEGLSIFKGDVKKFQIGKTPQIGWNKIQTTNNNSYLCDDYFYFVNSYYVNPFNKEIISSNANYNMDFCASVEYKNITYTKFDKQIDCLGTALVSKGLKGKRIAVIGKNCYEWIVSYLSVVNGTGIVVPLDKGLPEKEIETSLIRSESEAIIFEDDYIDMIKNIKIK